MFIIDYLGSEMPSLVGQKKKKDSLIRNLEHHFDCIADKYPGVNRRDFPNADHYRSVLVNSHFTQFPRVKQLHVSAIDDMLNRTLPQLMEMIATNLRF